MDLLDTHVYGLIGEDGFQRVVAAFYRRVPQDDILGAMYPADDLPAAEERLREFLIQRFGGPIVTRSSAVIRGSACGTRRFGSISADATAGSH